MSELSQWPPIALIAMVLVPALTMMQHDALWRFRARKERREATRTRVKPEVA